MTAIRHRAATNGDRHFFCLLSSGFQSPNFAIKTVGQIAL
ncbi:Uncharacterised protein [Vibrio cholerae]|nr:Uncharacterised protein [Vibrio cholerae]CSB69563.1 Uncharacterised protein [Vibrio cholerae]CSB87587.1 Uncharacterised protein [Vibrio cholerae]CSI55941.1 Uncharacterised protein [Vibrio cholerae]